jgi:hypothetical protein
MLVPKGRVLLTVAVDQLAESRRTASQTNDEARNAARVELRGEFYSGSSLTTIIDPGTGKTHTIFPERWGLERSWSWLERGECLLTSGLVYPPLGISFDKDPTVSIFMSEHDLQRLIAKQEVKQEAAPKQSGLPGRPTSKHLVLEKLNERIKANEIEATLDSEATWLRDWLGTKHSQAPQSGQSAIKNAIRETYNCRGICSQR